MNTERAKSKRTEVRDPVQARGIKTKERIIHAGRDLISVRGYHNVTADEIAGAAGVSVGSFYAYFADKRHFFLALVDEYLESGGRVVSEGAKAFSSHESADLAGLITNSIKLLLAAHRRSPLLMRELLKMALSDEEVKGRLAAMDDRVKFLLTEALVSRGIDRQRAAAISFIIYHASEGVIHTLTFGEGGGDEEAVMAEMTQLFAAYCKDIT
jgi:AcrR family transcriptional regulator